MNINKLLKDHIKKFCFDCFLPKNKNIFKKLLRYYSNEFFHVERGKNHSKFS